MEKMKIKRMKKAAPQKVKKAAKPGAMRVKRAKTPTSGPGKATKPGKVIRRKATKKATTNIIDARAMTKEAMKKGMEVQRYKREKNINKMLKGMK